MDLLLDILSWVCLMTGSILGISGAVGIFRFEEFYGRLHAASVTDTLCVFFIVLGLILQEGFTIVSIKLVFVVLLLWLTSPVATHALIRSAYETGLSPVLKTSRSASKTKGERS